MRRSPCGREREKEQGILETSKIRGPRDLVKNPPWRLIETSRKWNHLSWPSSHSRRSILLHHFNLPFRMQGLLFLLCNPLELMCFCLETSKHFYIRGTLLHVKGFIILEFIIHLCVQPLWKDPPLRMGLLSFILS